MVIIVKRLNFSIFQCNFRKSFSTTKTQNQCMLKSLKRPNLALKSYLNSNSYFQVLKLFKELLRKNLFLIDSFSILYTIKSCIKKNLTIEGKQIHGLSVTLGFEPNIFLKSSFIEFYSKIGNVENAQKVFDEILEKNIVCFTALISGYVNNRNSSRALDIFNQMLTCRFEPDQVTLTVALSACADIVDLDTGEQIHRYICQEKKVNMDSSLNNALINMYSKCGDIQAAKILFNSSKMKRNVTTWTSMIVGLALNGKANEALRLFEEMSGLISPNDVTFVGVLMACSHAGLVEEGKCYFKSMIEDYGLKPRLSHYGCMVDLLCRSGLLKEAYELIIGMPIRPNAVMWRTLLGACGVRGDIELACNTYERLSYLEVDRAGDDVIMSNAYAGKGMWEEKLSVRDKLKQRREPGRSSIGIRGQISEFTIQQKVLGVEETR